MRTFLELQNSGALPIEVSGEAVNGLEAVELAGRLQPDIVLLDLVMPVMDGVEATSRIMECSPHSRVIILTSFGEEENVLPAIRARPRISTKKYFLLLSWFRQYMRLILVRFSCIPRWKKLMKVAASKEQRHLSHKFESSEETLTEREREILSLIADGRNNHQIAEKLVISEKTVKTHVSNILNKLNLDDRTQAAIYALRHGLAKDKE